MALVGLGAGGVVVAALVRFILECRALGRARHDGEAGWEGIASPTVPDESWTYHPPPARPRG